MPSAIVSLTHLNSVLQQHTFGNVLHADIEHGVVQSAPHQELETQVYQSMVSESQTLFQHCLLTVNPLLISKSMSLLRLVPLDDQAVTESQCSTCVSGTVKKGQPCPASFRKADQNPLFIAIEERPRQGRLNVLHSLCGKLIGCLELFGGLVSMSAFQPCIEVSRRRSLTNFFQL
jgi:hypothetical protein